MIYSIHSYTGVTVYTHIQGYTLIYRGIHSSTGVYSIHSYPGVYSLIYGDISTLIQDIPTHIQGYTLISRGISIQSGVSTYIHGIHSFPGVSSHIQGYIQSYPLSKFSFLLSLLALNPPTPPLTSIPQAPAKFVYAAPIYTRRPPPSTVISTQCKWAVCITGALITV